MSNVRTRDYDGPRSLDPACAPDDRETQWKITCDSCGAIAYVRGEKPDQCDRCCETDKDALTITEVPV